MLRGPTPVLRPLGSSEPPVLRCPRPAVPHALCALPAARRSTHRLEARRPASAALGVRGQKLRAAAQAAGPRTPHRRLVSQATISDKFGRIYHRRNVQLSVKILRMQIGTYNLFLTISYPRCRIQNILTRCVSWLPRGPGAAQARPCQPLLQCSRWRGGAVAAAVIACALRQKASGRTRTAGVAAIGVAHRAWRRRSWSA